MGATHFLMKRLRSVATEMALHVLAYNLTRVINIMSRRPRRLPLRHHLARQRFGILPDASAA